MSSSPTQLELSTIDNLLPHHYKSYWDGKEEEIVFYNRDVDDDNSSSNEVDMDEVDVDNVINKDGIKENREDREVIEDNNSKSIDKREYIDIHSLFQSVGLYNNIPLRLIEVIDGINKKYGYKSNNYNMNNIDNDDLELYNLPLKFGKTNNKTSNSNKVANNADNNAVTYNNNKRSYSQRCRDKYNCNIMNDSVENNEIDNNESITSNNDATTIERINPYSDYIYNPNYASNMLINNPHIYQSYQTESSDFILSPNKFVNILTYDLPKLDYKRRTNEFKSVIHWGQRKLLLSEIYFLTKYLTNQKIIYAGGGPGIHLPILMKLMKHVNTGRDRLRINNIKLDDKIGWDIYDPSGFCKELLDIVEKKSSSSCDQHLNLHSSYFTDMSANSYINSQVEESNILFISDVRSANIYKMDPLEVEIRVKNDHLMQANWVNILKPKASMLKFRLEYTDSCSICNNKLANANESATHFEYFSGDVCLPVWGPQTTTETRLIVTKRENKIYCPHNYQSQMFHFNTIMRPNYYESPFGKIDGLDGCWDCSCEIDILTRYLFRFPTDDILKLITAQNIETVEDLLSNSNETLKSLLNIQISKLSKMISKKLTSNRTLMTPFNKVKINHCAGSIF